MAKIKYHIDHDEGKVVKQVKVGNRIEYETISEEKYKDEQTERKGCAGFLMLITIIFLFWYFSK